MNDRRAFLQRRLRIEYRRQLLVIDLNEIQSIFSLLERLRRHRGDPLAHETSAILRENRNIPIAPAVKNPAHVVAGQHRAHTRRFFGA